MRALVPPVALFALTWASVAGAHPEYPPVIDTTLGLTGTAMLETVLMPTGCQLCHNSTGGGDALRMFGNLMVENYGLSPSVGAPSVPSLESALVLLQMDNPAAVKDLKVGVNPNDDPVVFANALPTAEHGCSTAGGSGDPAAAWATAALVLFGAGAMRARRRATR